MSSPKNSAKLLRQIEHLEERARNGEVLNEAQLGKISRKQEIAGLAASYVPRVNAVAAAEAKMRAVLDQSRQQSPTTPAIAQAVDERMRVALGNAGNNLAARLKAFEQATASGGGGGRGGGTDTAFVGSKPKPKSMAVAARAPPRLGRPTMLRPPQATRADPPPSLLTLDEELAIRVLGELDAGAAATLAPLRRVCRHLRGCVPDACSKPHQSNRI